MTADQSSALRAALALRYRIERELGRGGMATVYLAEDLKHGRPVAIKVLRHEIAAILGSDRFLREIGFAAKLSHPNILPLHDSDQAGGFLYYVMPYVEGGTLQDRLERESRLSVDEALDITRQVADGLAHAHAIGVVHRDIKPANILLAGRHVFIADFGVARAIRQAVTNEGLTEPGLVVGTPDYMAPEQVVGASLVDGRADEYSLACVLYEMLMGRVPSHTEGKSGAVRRALRAVRDDVPAVVESALARALSSDASARFPTVSEFAAVLPPGTSSGPRTVGDGRRVPSRRVLGVAIGIPATALAIWWGLNVAGAKLRHGISTAPDTSLYVVFPLERSGGVAPFQEEQLLQDALARWRGVTVVDVFLVGDALARRGVSPSTTRDAKEVAVELGAGRYIRGTVSRIGDSIRVYAALYDATRAGAVVHSAAVKLGRDDPAPEVAFGRLADTLLFGGNGPATRPEGPTGTTSRPARQSFAVGLTAIDRWDLAAADSAFAAATRYDPQYAQAFLWLAQIRSWMATSDSWGDALVATWQSAAQRASAGRGRLSGRDQILSDALLALSQGSVEEACRSWVRLTVLAPHDFTAWYGLGNCVSRDDAVLPDSASPSRWRFRSSYQQATKAYERAFELLPSIHQSLRGGSYQSVRRLLMTSGSQLRSGRAVTPDTTTFAAYPTWQGDTLAFIPYARLTEIPAGTDLAVRHQRDLFRNIATAWVTAFPTSSDALEALAISLEMLGDPSALDTLRRARALATTSEGRLRAAGAEVWMRVRFSLPGDLAGLRAARGLADSLLGATTPAATQEPLLLASLAALTGRAGLAAALAQAPAVDEEWGVPAPLARTALPLLTYAALGGPLDTLGALERQVDSEIDNALPPSTRPVARLRWLSRAATLAFGDQRFRSMAKLTGRGDYLLDAQAALTRGDTIAVRRMFAELREARRLLPAADRVTLDALYPEARLLVAMKDDRGAAEWLDPTLGAIAATDPESFADPVPAGALVRAAILRADLADRAGDRSTAARWAAGVAALWSNADPFLQPEVGRMTHLAARAP